MTARYLSTFLNYEKNLNKLSNNDLHLERMRLVLSKLGSPQDDLKVIHIAGSKGKGSTAAFTAQILYEAGYRVGLYTSPHLYHLRERFRILDLQSRSHIPSGQEIFSDCISEKKFAGLIKIISPQLEAGRHHRKFGDLTYFEVLTIAAFCYFKAEKVDFVVLETGLGGRLDATNVCQSLVSAITPISLEHTQQLGKTLTKIATEKAGIIKENSVAIIAPQKPEVLKVIKAHCRKVGLSPILVSKSSVKNSLLGRHQSVNAAVAIEIIKALCRLGFRIGENAVKQGLTKTFWPLRFEIISKNIILDGAHNAESCQRLVKTVKEVFPEKKVVLIFGSSDDKDIKGMLKHLRPLAQEIILASAKHPRALIWNAHHVREFFPKENVFVADLIATACKFALKIAGTKGLILTTGSLFVAADARKIFTEIL